MIPINSNLGYAVILILAATMGALGGLVYELIQLRRRKSASGTPAVEVLTKTTLSDKAAFAISALVGAAAGIAIFFFFPPAVSTVTQAADGSSTTAYQYDPTKLVALALIAGLGGESFLNSIQARVLAVVNEQRVETAKQQVETVKEVSKEQVEQLKTAADNSLNSLRDTLQPQLNNLVQQAILQMPPGTTRVEVPPDSVRAVAEELNIDLEGTQIFAVTEPSEQAEGLKVGEPGTPLEESIEQRLDQLAAPILDTVQTQLDSQVNAATGAIEAAARVDE